MQSFSARHFLAALLVCALLGGMAGAGATWWAAARWEPARVALLGTPVPTATPPPPPPPTATATPAPAPTFTPTPTPSPTTSPSPTALPSPTPVRSVADVAAEAGAAVVTVINSRTTSSRTGAAIKELTWGSGVIVDARGYVLTNEHVVTGAQELVVSLHDGRDLFARRIAGDAAQDLALLKITRAGQYEALRWGDSARLRLGEAVIVLGSPLGNLPGSVTTGVVSGLERSVTVEDNAKMSGLIQTDAAINRGNSGGALLNVGGELMGIVTLIVRETSAGDDRHVQGVGFAAPANVARPLAEKWIAADNP